MRTSIHKLMNKFYLSRAAVDFFIVMASLIFFMGFFTLVVSGVILVLCLLANMKPAGPVWGFKRILWFLLMVVSLDILSQLIVLVYHAGLLYFITLTTVVIAVGIFTGKTRFWELKWHHGVGMALILVLVVESSLLTSLPDPRTCSKSTDAEENVEYLLSHGHQENIFAVPRFLTLDTDERTLFVAYRNVVFKPPYHRLVIVDLISGKVRRSHIDGGEIIGSVFDEKTDSFVAVLVFHGGSRESALSWFDRSGEVRQTVPLPEIHSDTYFCAVIPRKDEIILLSSRDKLKYQRNINRIERLRHNIDIGSGTIENYVQVDGRLYLSMGGNPLQSLTFPSVVALDLQELDVVAGSKRYLCGTYILEYDPVKGEFYTNANWSGTLHVLDRDLKPVRNVHVGGVLRSAALDSRGRRGYTCDYISHMVTAFSLDTGEILGTRQLSGKGCRALQVLGSGELIYSCGCGVLKIPPDAILTSDEDRVDIQTKELGRAFEAQSG